MKRWYPLRYIATLIWIGFLLAISFMEAPLKFQAPSVTLSIGLEIGRLVFGALNKVEWVLLLVIILSLLFSSSNTRSNILIGSLGAVLISQTFYLLPALDQRSEIIISGISPASNNLHFFYVALEVVKLILLATSTYIFIYRTEETQGMKI